MTLMALGKAELCAMLVEYSTRDRHSESHFTNSNVFISEKTLSRADAGHGSDTFSAEL
jgi:hypothetical protein